MTTAVVSTANSALASVKILIVEDEPEIAQIIDAFLRRESADCLIVSDGERAVDTARWWRPDVVILDLRLPGRDGLSVLADLRAAAIQPGSIILSALGEDIDKLAAFRLGCDDYVVKPFNPLEVVARAKVLVGRQRRQTNQSVLSCGNIRVDIEAFCAFVGSRPLDLTPTEFKLLHLLVSRGGRLITRGQMVDIALDDEAFDRSVDPHISRLRQKINRQPDTGVCLTSIRGEGYRLDLA
jgi:two-component system response regulator AdeR